MTEVIRENILELEAGPELDALVAERVMGWEEYGPCWRFGSLGKMGNRYKRDWSPSTDIAAAWEVVEAMNTLARSRDGMFKDALSLTRADGSDFCWDEEARGFGVQWNDSQWESGFVQTNGGGHEPDFVGWPWAIAHTAPLAICRAALLTTLESASPPPCPFGDDSMSEQMLVAEDLKSLREAERQRLNYIRQADYCSANETQIVLGRNAPKLLDHIDAQAKRIEELAAGPKWEVFQTCLDRAIEEGVEKVVAEFWRNEVIMARQARDKADEEIYYLKKKLAGQSAAHSDPSASPPP